MKGIHSVEKGAGKVRAPVTRRPNLVTKTMLTPLLSQLGLNVDVVGKRRAKNEAKARLRLNELEVMAEDSASEHAHAAADPVKLA